MRWISWKHSTQTLPKDRAVNLIEKGPELPTSFADQAWKLFAGLAAFFYALLRRTKRADCHKELRAFRAEYQSDRDAMTERLDRMQGSISRILREGAHGD